MYYTVDIPSTLLLVAYTMVIVSKLLFNEKNRGNGQRRNNEYIKTKKSSGYSKRNYRAHKGGVK